MNFIVNQIEIWTRGKWVKKSEKFADIIAGSSLTFLKAASQWTEGFLLGSCGGSSTSSYSSSCGSRTRRVIAETERRKRLF